MVTLPNFAAPRNERGLRTRLVAVVLLLVACGGDMADTADMSDYVAAEGNSTEGDATTALPTRQADACPLDVTAPPYWALQEEPPSDGIALIRRFTWGGDGEAGAVFRIEQVVGTPMLDAQQKLWIAAGGRLVATPTIVGAQTPVVAGPIETSQSGVRSQRWFFWLPAGLPERWVIFSLSLSVRSGHTWPDEAAVLATITSAVPGRCLEGS